MDLWLYSVGFSVISVPVATLLGFYFAWRWQREADPFNKLVWGLKGASWCLGVAALFSWFTLSGLPPALQMLRDMGYSLDIMQLPPEMSVKITNLVLNGIVGVFVPCVWAVCFSLARFLETYRDRYRTEDEGAPL